MIQRLVCSTAIYVIGQTQAEHTIELSDETIIQYCMFNDYENKEMQVVEFGFEGFTKPGQGIELWPQGAKDYCG